jgi:CRISPR-associated protein Cas2
MFIAVCYDIADNRRRNKVSNILEGFGTRVQESVFECDLSQKHLEELRERLEGVLTKEDGLRYYFLCSECLSKVRVAQGLPVTEVKTYFIV